ncbi:transposase [Cytobacillus spongiae]|uniref:transposase n=1 Tax=Cytobacillus spongiae TaxID=2901381 RepID=UPI001F275232|nr:transposase [Cytobacillus spongiae]UII57066.1 transposase [Cytobacillus spongiae]
MGRKYDHEFKEKVAIEAIKVNNISATAKKHGVNSNSLRKWVKSQKQGRQADLNYSSLRENEMKKNIPMETSIVNKDTQELLSQVNQLKLIVAEKEITIRKLKEELFNIQRNMLVHYRK